MRIRAKHINMVVIRCGLIFLCLSTPLFAGCGGSSNSASSPAIPTALTASAVAPNGLTGTLSQSAVTVPITGTVQYTLTLTNTTSQVVVIHTNSFNNHPPIVPASLTVLDSSKNVLYPPCPGGGDCMALGSTVAAVDVTLQPGQALSQIVPVTGFKTKELCTATVDIATGSGATYATSALPAPLTVLVQ